MKTLIAGVLLLSTVALAQGKQNDITPDKLPPEVKALLEQYVGILRAGPDINAVVKAFTPIAGGGVVGPEGALRSDVPRFSLKKDFDNAKYYADPLNITRVNATKSGGQGFGPTAIAGMVYKIWIAKKDGGAGMPAPISIMVPEGHPTITGPRVVNIGSL